ncbi:hypothetical protein F5878DRAFT_644954 [Lentinula raphanica]|uniref:Uncharacterized protein n=1 Tax=Lentinula raphanica TaxID=153919 RepID=A0AA38U961_9AGAR|nr:hypothetical protein F5878DRAFT_644954 [Lentinula raphanica]
MLSTPPISLPLVLLMQFLLLPSLMLTWVMRAASGLNASTAASLFIINLSKIFPSDDAPSTDEDFLSLDQLLVGLDDDTQSTVLSCLNFTSWGVFVNPSRVAPHPLLKTNTAMDGKSRSVVVFDDRLKTVYTMVGKIDSCYVNNPRPIATPDPFPPFIRGAGVIGLNQEVQNAIAHVGLLYGLTCFMANASNGVIDYQSAEQWASDIDPNNPDDVRPTVPIPSTNNHFPISNNSKLKDTPFFKDPLPFNHTIPIFDGRPSAELPAFSVLPWQLSRIGQRCYPLYNNGHTDLPRDSVVYVGFTIHAFTPKTPGWQPSLQFVSFNLQFLVLLVLPHLDTVDIAVPPSHVSCNDYVPPLYMSPSTSLPIMHRSSTVTHSFPSVSSLSDDTPSSSSQTPNIVLYEDMYH